LIFLQRLKLATSDLVYSLGLLRPIIKSHPEEKWMWPWARETPKLLGFPIIFLQRVKLATLNLAHSWGLSRTIIKSHAERGYGPGELTKIWRFPFNIYTIAQTEASDFIFNKRLGYDKTHNKIPCFALFTCVSKFCKNRKFCVTFADLIFRKIIYFVDTRCQILKAKTHQNRFRQGFRPSWI